MFLGCTQLVKGDYYNGENLGDISTIKPHENGYIFEMYDKKTYFVEDLTTLDVLLGGGDRIFTNNHAINEV